MELKNRKPVWDAGREDCIRAFYAAAKITSSPTEAAKLLNKQFLPSKPTLDSITRNVVISALRRAPLTDGLHRLYPQEAARIIASFSSNGQVKKVVKKPAPAAADSRSTPRPPRPYAPSAIIPDLKPVRLEDGKAANVLTLNDSMCSFPFGHPGDPDFAFCGRGRSRGPYCEDHARLSYQPHKEKKKGAALHT